MKDFPVDAADPRTETSMASRRNGTSMFEGLNWRRATQSHRSDNQRSVFADQARAAAAGDDEATALDEDFLAAMEYAMPPTTGTGMGVDRLLMVVDGPFRSGRRFCSPLCPARKLIVSYPSFGLL